MATTIPGMVTTIPGITTTVPGWRPPFRELLKVVAFRPGISGRLQLERVVAFDWNGWLPSIGIRQLNRPRPGSLALLAARTRRRKEEYLARLPWPGVH
jgi:hypothetical protein